MDSTGGASSRNLTSNITSPDNGVAGQQGSTSSTSSSISSSTTASSSPGSGGAIPLARTGWKYYASTYVPAVKQLALSGVAWSLRIPIAEGIKTQLRGWGLDNKAAHTLGEFVSGIWVGTSQVVMGTAMRKAQDLAGIIEAVPIKVAPYQLGQFVVVVGAFAGVAAAKFSAEASGEEFTLADNLMISAATGAGAQFVAATVANLAGMDMKATQPSKEAFSTALAKGAIAGGLMGLSSSRFKSVIAPAKLGELGASLGSMLRVGPYIVSKTMFAAMPAVENVAGGGGNVSAKVGGGGSDGGAVAGGVISDHIELDIRDFEREPSTRDSKVSPGTGIPDNKHFQQGDVVNTLSNNDSPSSLQSTEESVASSEENSDFAGNRAASENAAGMPPKVADFTRTDRVGPDGSDEET